MKKILIVAGARPNFMKIAPILRSIRKRNRLNGVVVHTGQHYDHTMSGSFFDSLGIGKPDFYLGIGSGSHADQTAKIMVAFEKLCIVEKPDAVVVVGDVNSTIAAGLVAKKLNIILCHVEAGLRSNDRTMPEEINRLATDAITDIFFTTEKGATENLLREGHLPEQIHFVGHVMIDNLFFELQKLANSPLSESVLELKRKLPLKYLCMTLHRPSNVDNAETLKRILIAVRELSTIAPVVFPCHPRTRKNIEAFGYGDLLTPIEKIRGEPVNGIVIMEPLGYSDFLYLWKDSCAIFTDSGGLQEESTALKVPCITIRESTERPVTVEFGSNEVVGTDPVKIVDYGKKTIAGTWKIGSIPELWDGCASERIVDVLEEVV